MLGLRFSGISTARIVILTGLAILSVRAAQAQIGAPTTTAATSVTNASFSANWTSVTGATAYFLDVSTDPGFGSFVSGYQNLNVGNVITQSVTGLSGGTTYYYQVRAFDGTNTSVNSNVTSVLTIPDAPSLSAASGVSSSGFTANWGAVTGAASYQLDVATDAGFSSFVSGYNNLSVAGTSQTVTGLSSGTTYYYRARAVDASGSSGNSGTGSQLTAPGSPTANAATAITASSFSANWSSVTGAASYQLDVATDAGFTSFVAGYQNRSVAGTSQSVTGLSAGSTYYYRVRAVNGSGTSGNSNTITTLTVPGAPSLNAATAVTTTSFSESWGSVPSATSYQLDVATDAGFTSFVSGYNNLSVAGTSQSITSLSAGTTYYCRVRAVNSSGTSGNSNTITTLTLPGAPSLNAASAVTSTSFTVSWGSVTSATSYQLDVATDAGFSSFVAGYNSLSVAGTSQSVSPLNPNTTYYYRVRAVNGTGASANSGTGSQLTSPAAPVASAATNITTSSFTANWAASAGANNYFLDVATDAGFTQFVGAYNNLSVGNFTNFGVGSLSSGTTYYYRVRASNGSSTSPSSNTITTATTTNGPTATAATAISATGFTANWGTVTGATSYQLDVSTDAGFSTFVSGYNSLSVPGTSQAVTGLSANTTYYYRVRAVTAGGPSTNSNTITVLTLTVAPTLSAASAVSSTGFTANWGAVSGASSYQIDVATDNGFTTFVTGYNNLAVSGTSQAVTGLSANTTYYYRVRAVNATGPSANSTTGSQLTAPPAPVANAATIITTSSFTANWSAATGATGYFLDVATDSNFAGGFVLNNQSEGSGTSASVSGLTNNTTYFYRVRAANAGGTSPNSNRISATTLPNAPGVPTATAATSVTTTSFTANWTSVSGATGYQLDVATDAGFTSFVSGYSNLAVAGISQSVTGLTVGTTYYYRARAVNAGGPSGNSNTISAPTLTAAPTLSATTAIGTTGFTVNWGAVTGATGYQLDVATDNTFGAFVTGYNSLAVAGTSQAVSGLSANTTYYFRVRGVDASGASANSSTGSQETAPPAPLANPGSAVTTSSFTANWAASAGATTYYLDVATDSTFVSGFVLNNASEGASLSAPVSGLTGNTTYYYRVRAANASGSISGNSNRISVTTTLSGAPTATAATAISATGFTANWNAVSGATGYQLDVATDNAFTSFVSGYNSLAVAGTSQAVTSLASGTTYYYRVRAVNAGGPSANSNTITALTLSAAPTLSAATAVTSTGFTANWAAVTGAASYQIDVATDNAFTAFVTGYNNLAVAALTQAVSGLTANTTYYYRVRAVNASGASANSTTGTQATAPTAPVATAATSITTTGFNANWNSVPGASGYFIDVSTDTLFGSFVTGYNNMATGITNSWSVSGLVTTTKYYYRIRASNGSSSPNSNVISTTTLTGPPTANAASSITTTGFTANWTAVTGATSYQLDVALDASFFTFVSGYNNLSVASTSQAVTGLSPATTYYYRVRAVDQGGASASSSVITVATYGTLTITTGSPLPSATAGVAYSNTFTASGGLSPYQWSISAGVLPSGYSLNGVTGALSGTSNIAVTDTFTVKVRAANNDSTTKVFIFSITAGGATKLVVSTQPSSVAVSGLPFAIQPVVQVQDALGNVVTSPLYTVQAVKGPKGAGTLSGNTFLNTSNGVATFTNLSYDRADTTDIQFVSGGLTSATSNDIAVSAGPLKTFLVEGGSGGAIGLQIAGTPFPIRITAKDSLGNVITSFNGGGNTVNITSNGTLLSGGGTSAAFTAGVLSTQVTIGTAGNISITATRTSGGTQSGTSNVFTVQAGNPSKFLIEIAGGGPIPTQTAGVPFNIRITAQDPYSNTVTWVTGPEFITSPGGGLVGSPVTSGLFTNGVLASQSVTLDSAGHGKVINVNFGTFNSNSNQFTVSPAAPKYVRVETAPDTTGRFLAKQNVSSGTSITVYANRRDSLLNFVDNVAADTWTLQVTNGGLKPTDLVPSGDRKSAKFTGNKVGQGLIDIALAGMIPVNSDTLTVVNAGRPNRIYVETLADGAGVVVPTQTVASGTPLTVYAIARDSAMNFVSNDTAKWSLQAVTGGVAAGDLVPNPGGRSAVFTARVIGSAQIRADSGGLPVTTSGTITVAQGPAATIIPLAGTSQQSALVNTNFSNTLGGTVKDGAGNNVSGVTVTFVAPKSGAGGTFSGGNTAVSDVNGIARLTGAFKANTKSGAYADTGRAAGVTLPAIFLLTNTPTTAASITPDSSSASESTPVSSKFPVPFSATVRDTFGNGVPGLQVNFVTVPGITGASGFFPGPSAAYQSLTDSTGDALAGTFTANVSAGLFTVNATTPALSGKTAIFILNNLPGSTGGVDVYAGGSQSKLVGATYDTTLAVRVHDGANNPIPNVLVHFIAPSSGPSGKFKNNTNVQDSAFTDASGIARSSAITANTLSGLFQVTAYTIGAAPAYFNLTNLAGPVANFLIEGQNGGPVPPELAQVPFQIKITARDVYLNTATSFGDSVDITSTGTLIDGRGRIGGFSGGINYSHTVTFLASGNWTITATHAGGVETGTSNSITVTNPAPVFSNIAPTSSIKGQSVDILINGSGFISGVTSISFGPNTTVTKGPTIISFYTLAATVLIDTGATEGPRTFRITNDPPGGGTAVVTNAFTIGSHPLPTLTSILPVQGNRLQTLGVVIKGSNFSSGVTSISLGQGITINSLSVDSATGISASITITVNAPVGAHDLVAINAPPGGGPDTLKGAFTVINPYPQVSAPTLISPFNGATNLYTRQQLRWTSDTAATSYHVQLSLQNTFATLLLDNPALTDTTCVVRGLLNDTTYYWRVSGANIGGSGPYSGAFSFSTGALYPSKFAVTDSVYFPARANPGDYPSTDYQIFGLPGASYKPLSSYMSGTVKQDWIAYWDNGAASNFWVAYSASNPIFTFAPGRAFWILQKGSLMLRDSVASAPLDTSGSARIGLQAGWNLISNPFPVPINWSYVQSLSGEPADSLQLWMYDGGFSLATTFLPYTGYYVYNGPYTPQGTATATVLDSLSIPFSGLGTLSKSVAKVAAGDWRVAVSLKSDVGMDRSTAFGASSGATKGLNRFNYRKPRPMAGIPEVYFNRSEWDPVYNVFATDIRPTVGTLEKWSMEISSSLHKPMQLQFDGVVNVPPDLEVYLIDETDARSADLRKSGTYPFRPAMDISRFTIVVGSAEAVKREIESILPRDFSLGVNYPNPFNPTTTIPVALPVHAQIQLKIYNILGQEVRTVFDGALDGGRYWFTWDGRNESGAPVATGVYISRLTTSTGKQYTGKMLLLK